MLDNRLTLRTNLASTVRDNQFGFDDAFRYASTYNPTAPVFEEGSIENGGYFQRNNFDFFNPVAINELNENSGESKSLLIQGEAEYEIIDNLRLLARVAQVRENDNNAQFYSKVSPWPQTVNFDGFDIPNGNGVATRTNNERINNLFETTLSHGYNFESLNRTQVDAVIGYSYQDFNNSGIGAGAGDLFSDEFRSNNLRALNGFTLGQGRVFSYRNTNKLIAFFGRVNFNINNLIFASASLRREGSSRNGRENRWGSFPAVSAGINLEQLFDIPTVSSLKPRISYGITGAQPNASYRSLLTFAPAGNFFFNGNFVPSYAPNRNQNERLQWETKRELNAGFDFVALNNRLTGSFDWYTRTTEDLIYEANVPQPPNLAGITILNTGELRNNGVELAVNFDAIDKGNFGWSTGFNFSTFNAELVTLSNDEFDFGSFQLRGNAGSPGLNETPLVRVEEGQPLGQLWGWQLADPDNPLDEAGNWNFLDTDGQPGINEADRQVIGNAFPDFTFGWNNTVRFGKLSVNAFVRGAVGHDLMNMYRAFYESPVGAETYNVVKTEYYLPELTDDPKLNSYHVEDASFAVLDNATISYALPALTKFVRSTTVYLSGQNLFYITDYSGPDPEVRYEDAGDVLAAGIDRRNSWFTTRTFTLGVNFGL